MAPFVVVTRSRLAKLYKKPWLDWDARYYVVDVATASVLWAGSSVEWATVAVAHLEAAARGAELVRLRRARRRGHRLRRQETNRLRAHAKALEYDRRTAVLMARLISQLPFIPLGMRADFLKGSLELGSEGTMQLWDALRRQSMDEASRITFKRIYGIVVNLYRAVRSNKRLHPTAAASRTS
jgi:hypothetical protein